jgi:hypothetical protein
MQSLCYLRNLGLTSGALLRGSYRLATDQTHHSKLLCSLTSLEEQMFSMQVPHCAMNCDCYRLLLLLFRPSNVIGHGSIFEWYHTAIPHFRLFQTLFVLFGSRQADTFHSPTRWPLGVGTSHCHVCRLLPKHFIEVTP